MKKMVVSAVQMKCSRNLDENLESAKKFIKESKSSGADLVLLPELFGSRYFCSTEDIKNFDLAEPVDGKTNTFISNLAKEVGISVICPFYEKRAPGLYHNSTTIYNRSGDLVGLFRKMHIPHDPLFYEKYYFTPGEAEDGFKSFDVENAKIGVLICWDQWYPEGARCTALKGAEILFYPTAIGWHPSEKPTFGSKQVDAWRTIQRSHAIANGVFVVSANRVGFEDTANTDGLEFFGNSFICDPFGEIIASADHSTECLLVSEIDLSLIEETRRNWPFLRDRRIDAYSGILNRWGR